MTRLLRASAVLTVLCVGSICAAQSNWSPTVDSFGSSRAQYVNRDMEECRMLASDVGGSAVGRGARGAVGAAAGGIGRGVGQASQSEQEFRRAFSNCMRQRGHRVLN